MGASDRSPPPSVVEKRTRAARLLLGVVVVAGLWIGLWQAIGSSKPEAPKEVERPETSEKVAAAPTPIATQAEEKPAEVPSIPRYDAPVGPEPLPTVRLHGSIVRARDGTAIPVQTRLKISDEEWEERLAEVAGGSGYEFQELHTGRWNLRAAAQGFRTLEQSIDLDGESKDVQLDLRMQPADTVRVRLVGSLGEKLKLVPEIGGFSVLGLNEVLLAKSKAAMDRVLARAIPKHLELTVLATGEEPGRFLDPEDARQRATGRFFSAGLRIRFGKEKIDSLEFDENRGFRLENGTSLGDLPEDCSGILELSEPLPAYASLVVQGFVIRSQPISPGADEVVLGLSREDLEGLPARASLRVLDVVGDRLPEGLRVQIGEPSLGSPITLNEPDGSITVGYLLPGPAQLTINANEHDAVEETVLIQPGTTTDLGTFRLRTLGRLRADVADEDGKPAVVAFNIFPLDRYEAARKPLELRHFSSNSSGVLDIASIGRGQHLIAVNDPNWAAPPCVADTTIEQTGGIQIRVSKGTDVRLKLRAEPPLGARISIRTGSGLPVDGCRCKGREPMQFRLAPGRYSVELFDGETWLASESLAVGSESIRQYFPR